MSEIDDGISPNIWPSRGRPRNSKADELISEARKLVAGGMTKRKASETVVTAENYKDAGFYSRDAAINYIRKHI